MRLLEALEINTKRRASSLRPFRTRLVSGFLPLHFGDLLQARLNLALPDRHVVLESGVYGDLSGNLDRALSAKPDAIAIALEWQDLDSRLGLRQLGGWTPEVSGDIGANTAAVFDRLASSISASSHPGPIAICPPTLPLPPFSHEDGWTAGRAELLLNSNLSGFLSRISKLPSLRIASMGALNRISPAADRFDVQSELAVGIPYKMAHADAVAQILARLIQNPVPKKGLITDLDDTVWRGILGEVGPKEICWDLSNKAQIHGVYQQFLMALAARGVLLAVASKNDPALVEQAFTREDLALRRESIFPVEASWGRKSEAVGRILKAWNVGADSVIFVDDSPMELDEVKIAYPEIETRLFPARDAAAAWRLIVELQDQFGKREIREEDRLRLSSLRSAGQFAAGQLNEDSVGDTVGASQDTFLSQAQATVTIDTRPTSGTGRALELINKTNQFNINGKRLTEAEWDAQLAAPESILQVVSYQDKFGPLGVIAVLAGRSEQDRLRITCWVMSCRAFARRIEYQCLRALFERGDFSEVLLDYEATPRNQPVCDFLTPLLDGTPNGEVRISRAAFLERSPQLFHSVNFL